MFAALGLLVSACASSDKDVASPVSAAQATTFENPGGMWMPTQMADHGETLRGLGLEYDPAALTDPTSFPLGAIVSLGFCSGSFVSEDGLIVTNHHCAVPVALQYNSTPERNLLEEGYLAANRGEELWAGPQQRIYVTTAVEDVTEAVYAGTEGMTEVAERFAKIEENISGIQKACNAEDEDVRCSVRSFFEGAEYYQLKALAIRDVRLVYAPHAGVGVYGGEIDNWRWPRHTGDFTFLRAYVGPDGKPADYSPDNVPFEPAHHLKVATEPLEAGDLVMVAGYPGRTSRLATADLVRFVTETYYPYAIEQYEQRIELLEGLAAKDPELAIKVNRRLRSWNNGLTNNRGMLDGLGKGGLAGRKADEEAELRAWIQADPQRVEAYGDVLDALAALNAPRFEGARARYAAREILGGSTHLDRAFAILDAASKRTPDSKSKKGAKEEDDKGADKRIARMRRGLEVSQGTYAAAADAGLFTLALQRAAGLDDAQRPEVFGMVAGEQRDAGQIAEMVAGMYEASGLGDVDTVLGYMTELDQTDVEALKAGKKLKGKRSSVKKAAQTEPFLQLAAKLMDARAASQKEEEAYEAARSALNPRYVAALREFKGAALAPDANSTLRITYGTVRGYRPTPESELYTPFTTISEMVAKHTGEDPFVVPPSVLEAVERGEFGGYVDAAVGEVPVDFLADLDITGGNSGSACINARGEIVGLAFDGNYEAMASDWVFMPEITRSIQVDFRYVMWLMDAVDGADHLLEEMGVTPSIDNAVSGGGAAVAPR